MKIAIAYESMFGNTREVAEAISGGLRAAQPDADVECVAVGDAAPELIRSADLLVVGGPTHIRGMTSGFSRKIGVSGEEKAEAEGQPAHELEADAEGPGVREWFDGLPKVEDESWAAAFDTRLDSHMAGGAARGIARRPRKHGYHVVRATLRALSLRTRTGPFAQANSSEPGSGAHSWHGLRLVRCSSDRDPPET